MAKIINELTVDELKNLLADLEQGIAYNDIKAKYDLGFTKFNDEFKVECNKLIAEKSFEKKGMSDYEKKFCQV